MAHLDAAIIEAIREQALVPEAIAFTVEQAAAIVERELRQNPERPRQLEAEAQRLRREIDKYVAAVAKADDVPELLAALRQRKERLAEVEQERSALATTQPNWTPAEIRALSGDQLRHFDELLLGDVPGARQALRKLLPEPLRLSPVMEGGRRTLRFEGVTTLGPLLQKVWRPQTEPIYSRQSRFLSAPVSRSGSPRPPKPARECFRIAQEPRAAPGVPKVPPAGVRLVVWLLAIGRSPMQFPRPALARY